MSLESGRNLTDADVDAVAGALIKQIRQEFFLDVGRGFLSLVWKGAILALLALAVYGAAHR